MTVKTRAVLVFIALCATTVSAQNAQTIVPISSSAYRLLRYLAIEGGHVLPSQSRPYSADSFESELSRVATSGLSAAGRLAAAAIRAEYVSRVLYNEGSQVDGSAPFAFGAGLNATLELHPRLGYLPEAQDPKTNDVLRYPIDHGWERGVLPRPPMIEVPLSVWLYRRVHAHIELEVTEEPATIIRKPGKLTNIIEEPYDTDLHFPDRVYLSFGDAHWNLLFGRDLVSWGNGRTGNLLVSGSADYYDGLALRTFFRNFTFASTYLSFEPWLTPTEEALDDVEKIDRYKALFAHRFEFRFFDRVQLALAESVMYGRRYPEVAHLNPLMVFHNWYIAEFANSELTAELDVTPIRGVNLYGQFVLYQYQSAIEVATWPGADAQPNAYGYLLGVEGVHAWGQAYLAVVGEWVRTNPWLYTVRYASPLISYSMRRRVTAHTRYYLDRAVGYRYGPDVDAKTLRFDYLVPGRWGVGGHVEYRQKGEMRFWDFYADGGAAPIPENATERRTPSGDYPERRLVVAVDGEVSGTVLDWRFARRFGVYGGIDLIAVESLGNVAGDDGWWLEIRLGMRVDI